MRSKTLRSFAVVAATAVAVLSACGGSTPARSASEVAANTPIPANARHVRLNVVTGSQYGASVKTLSVFVEDKAVRVDQADGAPRLISIERWNQAREVLNTGLRAATPATPRGCYHGGMDCWFRVSNDGHSREGCCLSPVGLAVEEGAELLTQ
jgi:hypothetical protein